MNEPVNYRDCPSICAVAIWQDRIIHADVFQALDNGKWGAWDDRFDCAWWGLVGVYGCRWWRNRGDRRQEGAWLNESNAMEIRRLITLLFALNLYQGGRKFRTCGISCNEI
jgi:hypothetical protein